MSKRGFATIEVHESIAIDSEVSATERALAEDQAQMPQKVFGRANPNLFESRRGSRRIIDTLPDLSTDGSPRYDAELL